MRYPIRVKIFGAMGITVLLFMIILTLFHVFFYEKYALNQNQKMLTSIYENTNNYLLFTGKLNTDALYESESNLGLRILILNESMSTLFVVENTSDGSTIETSQWEAASYANFIRNNKDSIEEFGYITHTNKDPVSGSQFLYLYGLLKNGDYLILRTPLPAMEANIQYSRFFILIAGLITMVLALIIAYVISGRFSRPLVEINTITNHMSHLDFSSKYSGVSKDEIGELGHNINLLSDQLESTIKQLQMTNNRLEEELKKERQIDDMRQNFLANVSHDLKTPLAIIQGYAEGLKENISENQEDREFYCNVIIDESERMNKLVRQILNLSRLELGKISPEPENIEFRSFVDTIADRFSLILNEKKIQLKNIIPDTIVSVDVDMISQVLVNLITNAVEHTPPNGEICISGEYLANKLRVFVYNDGNCLAEDDLDKIWLSFYKVDKARTRTYGGTGLGLAIVKTIIEAHGNEVGVKNLEHGVAFWFDLTIG